MKKKSPIKENVVILFIVLFLILIFTPIPYYQSEIISCKMGQICPEPGWYLGKSIGNIILDLTTSSSRSGMKNINN